MCHKIQASRANNEAQVIESTQKLIAYILKYVMEPEEDSAAFGEAVKKLHADTEEDTTTQGLLGQPEEGQVRGSCKRTRRTESLTRRQTCWTGGAGRAYALDWGFRQ